MNNSKNITYSLLAIISFSLVSVGAQAGGISIRIGGFGYGSHHAYNSHHPSAYSHYRNPVVTYRHHYQGHHYQPYYGYRYKSHYRSYGRPYYQERHNYRHHHSHYSQASQHHNRHDIHDSHGPRHNRIEVASSKKHRR